jgi:hypothetical protein
MDIQIMQSITSEKVIEALKMIFATHGLPYLNTAASLSRTPLSN